MWAQPGLVPGPSWATLLTQNVACSTARSPARWFRAGQPWGLGPRAVRLGGAPTWTAAGPSLPATAGLVAWVDSVLTRQLWPELAAWAASLAQATPVGPGPAAHWRHPQVSSAATYFENNQALASDLATGPLAAHPGPVGLGVAAGFLRPHPFYFNPSRGFKTRRRTNFGGVPFKQTTSSQSEAMTANQESGRADRIQGHKAKELSEELYRDLRPMIMEPAAVKQALEMSYNKGLLSGITTASGIIEPKAPQGKVGKGLMDNLKTAALVATVIIICYIALNASIASGMMKSELKVITPQEIDVTFDDVQGCDEAKQELQEIVEFLINPDKFTALGGKLPNGCLLVGPPGTGKTLLARAVAGQAGVPFFHAVGSEFEEVFVGQGARRVRDLFKAAKEKAPCVIFIDEIDSVGSHRSKSMLSPYANQTINQLLSEMDGFVSNEGVIVLGATNRESDLDRALLRPGRFDTRVEVPKPDLQGRRAILQLYLSKIKHDHTVLVDTLAKMSIGFSGADLENMVNTAAIRAATDGKSAVSMTEFEYSHDKHLMGTDWKSRVRDEDELKITAYHEAGHALVGYFTKDAHNLHKVTIVAKGSTGGHTAFLPKKEQQIYSKCQLLANLDVSMGGRAAEELIFGKDMVSAGCASDLSNASNMAENMVKRFGMSEKLGLRVYPDPEPGSFTSGPALGPGTSETIDHEINQLLNDAYKRAINLLKTHRNQLEEVAQALLHYETLDADDVEAIIGGNIKNVEKKLSSFRKTILSSKNQEPAGNKEKLPPPLVGSEVLVS